MRGKELANHPQANDVVAKNHRKDDEILVKFGFGEICLGFLSVVFGTLSLMSARSDDWLYPRYTVTCQGIWCGLILIACGIYEMNTKGRRTSSLFDRRLQLCSVSAVSCLYLVILSFRGAKYAYGYRIELGILHFILVLIGFSSLCLCVLHFARVCVWSRKLKDDHNYWVSRKQSYQAVVTNGKDAFVKSTRKYDIPSVVLHV